MTKYKAGIVAVLILASCNKKVEPVALGTSPNGHLSRYDLIEADYDVSTVASFVASYDSAGRMANLFEKAGQTAFSFNLVYRGGLLVNANSGIQSAQQVSYDPDNRLMQIDYTTLTDTGKIVYTYDGTGRLTAMLDSVQKPLALPQRNQYLYTYDAAGNNVTEIVHNTLDLEGRPTLVGISYYAFDDHPNPFTVFPRLQYAGMLPGDVPATVNKNNIVSAQLVGTILNPASPGSIPQYDTITNYRTTRTYNYGANGYPVFAMEQFDNVQFGYSGIRTFTYEY